MIDLSSFVKKEEDTHILYEKKFSNTLYTITIFTGIFYNHICSEPEQKGLDINSYKKVGASIISNHNIIHPNNVIDPIIDYVNSISKIEKHLYYVDLFMFDLKTLESVINWMGEGKSTTRMSSIKTGGICRVCGDPDPYAPLGEDNKCFCYRHFNWQKS